MKKKVIPKGNFCRIKKSHVLSTKELKEDIGLKPGEIVEYFPESIRADDEDGDDIKFINVVTEQLVRHCLPLYQLAFSRGQKHTLLVNGKGEHPMLRKKDFQTFHGPGSQVNFEVMEVEEEELVPCS